MKDRNSTFQKIAALKPVSRETQERFKIYVDLLNQWQKRINLVAPSTLDDVWDRHVFDSVQTFNSRPQAKTWIDLGSGAGFPGLVTAILLAEENGGKVDLIESAGKKCAFMQTVVRETGLKQSGIDVVIHNDRIENVLPNLARCDAISARALASLHDLLTMTEVLLTDKTVGIFAKGRDHKAEIDHAHNTFKFNIETKDSLLGDGSCLLIVSNVERRAS